MSRELKFRAWDKSGKKMVYFNLDQLLSLQGKMETPSMGIEDEPHNRMYETIMQYTGLKDKNGREIYEGDIVKNGRHDTAEVVFKNGSFATYIEPGAWLEMSQNSFDFEIIGNVWDHPQLLRKESA